MPLFEELKIYENDIADMCAVVLHVVIELNVETGFSNLKNHTANVFRTDS